MVPLLIFTMMLPVVAQRRTDLPFREDGKWYYKLNNKKYGPYYQVSDLSKSNGKWLFISEEKDEGNLLRYYAITNAGKETVYGPYDYINYRISGVSATGNHFYFFAFKGDKETSDQEYFFIIDGKQYGPYTSLTRELNFYCNDEIWIFKAVRDGKFSGRWHSGGKERLYIMGKEYDILTSPAGFWVESVSKISANKYEIKVAIDVGSRRQIKTIIHTK